MEASTFCVVIIFRGACLLAHLLLMGLLLVCGLHIHTRLLQITCGMRVTKSRNASIIPGACVVARLELVRYASKIGILNHSTISPISKPYILFVRLFFFSVYWTGINPGTVVVLSCLEMTPYFLRTGDQTQDPHEKHEKHSTTELELHLLYFGFILSKNRIFWIYLSSFLFTVISLH